MEQVLTQAPRVYEVIIDAGVLPGLGLRTAALTHGRRAVTVTNSDVGSFCGEQVAETLRQEGFPIETSTFLADEASENPRTLSEMLIFFARAELTRQDVVIALGGGVTGDLAGLAVSLYFHGIPCVQVPISLLMVVNSSVSGKTMVDLPEGKGLAGTFTQPYLILCDSKVLDTLALKVFTEGMAKVVKYDMIRDRGFLKLLLRDEAIEELERVIAQCVRLKCDVVAEDEQDFGERQTLGFGHTLGHVTERKMDYKLFHGNCVAIDMALVTRVLVRDDRCPESCEKILERLLKKYQLPSNMELPSERMLVAVHVDKKCRGKNITPIELSILGNCVLAKTSFTELARFLELGC